MKGGRGRTAADYIKGACELHLQAHVTTSSGLAAIERFLSGKGGDSEGGVEPCPRLFVWIPRRRGGDASDDDEWAVATASTDSFDGNNLGAIAFINTNVMTAAAAAAATASAEGGEASEDTKTSASSTGVAVRSAAQLQCMTISPRIYDDEEEATTSESEDKETVEDAATAALTPGSATFLSLQMYARHCFVPAVQAIEALDDGEEKKDDIEGAVGADGDDKDAGEDDGTRTPTMTNTKKKSRVLEGLEDKIRELDFALGQVRRTALGQIPNVVLTAHPDVTQAAAKIPSSGKIDLEELGLGARLDDDSFLNEVQSGISSWISQIRKVTVLPGTTPFPSGDDEGDEGGASNADLEEVSFWVALEVALKNIRAELSKPDVQLTLTLLKSAKRFLATIALENNTGLDAAEAHATDVANYLRNYPIQSLAAARDLTKIGNSMDGIFDHLPKVRQSRFYDLERCARLLEATTLTMRQRLESVLREKYRSNGIVLTLSFERYETEVHGPTQDIFVRFDLQYEQFTDFFLEQGRRRRTNAAASNKTPAQIIADLTLHHQVLRDRLDQIHHFRSQHEKLRVVVIEVLSGDDDSGSARPVPADPSSTGTSGGDGGGDADEYGAASAIREVEEAPMATFATVDVLDLTSRGRAAFAAALESYDRKIDAIEERLARLLRDKLTACQDAEDMFRVFARFNPLLTRTRVRSAVKEFQIRLISTVGQAIHKLQSKFTHKYESSAASRVALLRGIPPVSGKIMWAKQMERQVNALMKRMGDVLGQNWGQQLEGRELRRSGDELLAKLDSRSYFRSWVTEWERELSAESAATARLKSYPIVVVPEGLNNSLIPKVNFDERHENLFREVRQLKWLGYDKDIPRTVRIVSEEALLQYPHAMALKTALRSYATVRDLVTKDLEPLVMPQMRAIWESIGEAFDVSLDGRAKKPSSNRRMRWDSKELPDWVAGLTELVTRFEERVETLLRACDKIDVAIDLLGTVDYDAERFRHVIGSVQKTVDDLSLAGYPDLSSWVGVVNSRLAAVLARRLDSGLHSWSASVKARDSDGEEGEDEGDSGEEKKDAATGGAAGSATSRVRLPTINVEIVLRSQEIMASPHLPTVRTLFLNALHDYMAVVCSLPRPTSGRFEVFTSKPGEGGTGGTFHQLVYGVSPEALAKAYATIEEHMAVVGSFVKQWLEYQALWDTRVVDVANAVGEDVEKWHALLVEATEARSALDSSTTTAEFGPVVVRYNKVQSQISLKYDSWQRELQACFAEVLGKRIHELHDEVSEAKAKLEGLTLDGTTATTNEIVLGVTFLQEVKRKLEPWKNDVGTLINSERLLKRQRFNFKGEWMEASRVKGQYGHMQQVLNKRVQTMEDQIPLLQSRVMAEDKAIAGRVQEVMGKWEQEKPLRGGVKPQDALEILSRYEFSFKKVKLDDENLVKAKDALGLDAVAGDSAIDDCLEEVSDLKEVWESIAGPYDALQEVKEVPWATAVPRKIRKSLDEIIDQLRGLANRIRQYDAYTHFSDTIKSYIGGHGLLTELKSEALKDRHWKQIMQQLGIRVPFTELTVGLLWDHGVHTRKKEMGEILTIAQGEMALEVFLQQVRDKWMKEELELVLYQNRVRLIRGWDDVFATLDDHMGGLVLMKSSPYYRSVREFQEEGKLWEERLTKLRAAFDAWVDVQRRWVYLEGIFFGSADIKAQLPNEWSRFKSVDGEFVTLMRRISSRPYAMEALNIENLPRTLERLGNLMGVIQRALGDYLEKQRSDFSRFYFLGDDDLLEIIGNAGEPGKVLSHVGKMFAGVASAGHDHEATLKENQIIRFDSMVSKDGEVVTLDNAIDVMAKDSAKDWLNQLETGMQTTLAKLLESAVADDASSSGESTPEAKKTFVQWATKFPAQVMILASLINWSMGVDAALNEEDAKTGLTNVLKGIEGKLEIMAETVLLDLPAESRKKFEQLITELVHQRDVTRSLIEEGVSDSNDFRWLYHLRFTYNAAASLKEKLRISLSNAIFFYGFEYLGIGERLVQTPLTDRCYLTLTQALHFRMGGNPFGPAGTGKTESVKALGSQLGRFVVVMNCDETFDFGAMGRLFCGLCQVGAWGCFDEFNRLEERILSAVSQQILTIQRGLVEHKDQIELLGRPIKLHENVGIFVTMNPGYAGRSNLPDNLKTLFRSVAMVVPDRKLIAQVMLFSQGIVSAEHLAGKIVDVFEQCKKRMSKQSHYDFGLRALKTLLVSAGGLKRTAMEKREDDVPSEEVEIIEKRMLIQGTCNNVLPKLVGEDLPIFEEVLQDVFPGSEVINMEDAKMREILGELCKVDGYLPGEKWVQKVLQLKQVIEMRHGVMLVGPVGSGKSAALKVLMEGLEKIDGTKGEMYIIDPKAMDKESLYGVLDGTTMEWTDGVFTNILRTILGNQRGESDRRHWIVFDGDVDPEWAENLNSVLDDNKLLTLPSGERLSIPDNVRIILEVDSLAYATPATVSRCGMVWFSEDTVSVEMCLHNVMGTLRKEHFGATDDAEAIPARDGFLDAIKPLVISDNERTTSLTADALDTALKEVHVMQPSRERLLQTLKALLRRGIQMAVEYDENHLDFPITGEHMEKFAKRFLLHALLWSFAGSSSWEVRKKFGDMLLRHSGMTLPDGDGENLADYRVLVETGELELWRESVPRMEIESHKVVRTDVVITTTDTVRHTDVLGAWLLSRMPLILCGPPGSGKTMTLTNVLQSIQGIVLASLNFSSRTTPEIILKTFTQYCAYVRRGKDLVLEPVESLGSQSWLVIFCDEINLPQEDSYGTQRVIMFMRQLVERRGFWRNDNVWVTINRIQFVGACNPPTDAGRVDMSHRFMRHAPLLLVDFPSRGSLLQIYRTFNGGMLKLFPNLKGETEPLTEAMVEVYKACQSKFTPEMQPQYFYSPRELSRWVRGVYEAIVDIDQGLTRDELVRLWAHEALRLFCDRLVNDSEKKWCESKIDEVARRLFAAVDHDAALARPMFYSSWLSKDTRQVGRDELKEFLKARLKVFYEEELDVPLVLFDEVLEHILRIDRVLRQPMGHCLLVGDSGAGKTVLSKFVSWMNGLSIFQIKAHSRYSLADFNEDLRGVMRRVGVEGEKVCFIFDEGNALESGFLESMNALLASGEVPGLFEGDDYTALMSACRESATRDGVMVESEEELWRRFISIVQRNLHVVFTMNPSGGEWASRSTTSPALFNRCVVDWFGTWGPKAMGEVGKEFTLRLDMGDAEAVGGSWGVGDGETIMATVAEAFDGSATNSLHQAVVAALVEMHKITKDTAEDSAKSSTLACRTYLSPRDYLALIQNFVKCVTTRREIVEDEQLHVNAGLSKLVNTQENVAELKAGLGAKEKELREKETLANNKLQQMVADQNEAEKRKEEAERTSLEVEAQEKEINVRREEAQRDLDDAEPALLSAQASVKSIKKRDLDEVRNLVRPPNNVRLTLECVAIMLGEKKLDWGDIRKMLSKSDFIPSILSFDVDKLTQKQIKTVQEKYLDGNADLTADSVMRSSKACGPLFKWAESQVKYSAVYNRVQPLREEVEQLEQDAKVAKDEKDRLEKEVDRLESSIKLYKEEYARLIRDVEALKSEMEVVSTKVNRAESLIKSLSQESERWSKSSEQFQSILRNIVGDGLLMAAFLTYSGFFDFKARTMLMKKWRHALDLLGIEYREDLSIIETLSKASERLRWQGLGLPGDSLSMENGVIMEHCVRFPLIIDPSGDAIEFVMNKYRDEKIQKTSFVDRSFMKTLAGAVRFGTTLLVENVEQVDPVLNPILNREIQRTGGRSLVRIGTEDVDYSPKFNIILTTKNPAAKLTPDLCSRVTLVNFTVTPASLQSQSMSLILKAEKPEVEEQRINLVKLQGEQRVKLRELEDQMLSKIRTVEGSILDDDRVVEGMEVLMKEGAQVEEQIAKSADIMKEVEAAINMFEPLSGTCRDLFVLLEGMREISFLYEFSAKFFMNIISSVLKARKRDDSDTDAETISSLKKDLFAEVAARVGRGLSAEDKIVFGVHLARASTAQEIIPDGASVALEEITTAIEDTFGEHFPWHGRGLNSLKSVVYNDVDGSIPLMLCSAPGHDVSGRVEAMARVEARELSAVAMGSAEGFGTAENFIATASKRGSWVMLKNCHLCTEWLEDTLVKKVQSLGSAIHPDFRLFLTSEINPRLPTALLRLSDIIVAEAPTGIKASLSRFFTSIPPERFHQPVKNRLYLILGWVHAVIQERLRYIPAGWSERYEFTESDAIHALDVIDTLIDEASGGKKTAIDPEKLPWDAIRSTLCKSVFGGRITKDSDQEVLDNLVQSVFVSDCYNVNFKIVPSVDDSPALPEKTTEESCLAWIDSLPTTTPTSWVGLDGSAEALRLKAIAESVMSKVKQVSDDLKDGD